MDHFIGQIIMFAGTYAPRGWAFCNGQLLAISNNPALFAILRNTYGGDGRTTFALPDLRGRLSMHAGTGPGLTTRRRGQRAGTETVTLDTNQIPAHDHTASQPGTSAAANTRSPLNAQAATLVNQVYNTGGPTDATMMSETTGMTGDGGSHDNVQPYLCVNYIIALEGIWPSRS